MCDLASFPNLEISQEAKKQLALMLKALKNVKKDYLWYKDYASSTEKESIKEHLERVFAYELYHQWRMVLDLFEIPLYLNGEISKAVKDAMKNNKVSVLFPDFVLHGGQNCDDKSKQLIACEIKRKDNISNEKIKGDIESLINYIDDNYFTRTPFQCGVLIFVGTTLDDLLEKNKFLTAIKDITNLQCFSKRIICVSYDFCNEQQILQLQSLEELIGRAL